MGRIIAGPRPDCKREERARRRGVAVRYTKRVAAAVQFGIARPETALECVSRRGRGLAAQRTPPAPSSRF